MKPILEINETGLRGISAEVEATGPGRILSGLEPFPAKFSIQLVVEVAATCAGRVKLSG